MRKEIIGAATLYLGDCLGVLKAMPDNSVDSVVTDPPYGLSFMGKRWDYDVPSVEIWTECLRVLKPGGHLLAFAGTRTQHRMAARIEDAGFEIRDMIAWVYGSGFPKSQDVSKAIDKHLGAKREVVGVIPDRWTGKGNSLNFSTDRPQAEVAVTGEAATGEAATWQGWGTALKPALEPITVARKPLVGTVAENVLAYGTGAINIDGCRVGDFQNTTPSGVDRRNAALAEAGYRPGAYQMGEKRPDTPPGRWPANLIHDGSDEVVAAFPNSAARFFYSAKASKADRAGSKHPTVKPVSLMQWLCRLITPPGGTVLDPFAGSGTTGAAARLEGFRAVLIEREAEYQQDIRNRFATSADLLEAAE